MSSLVPTNPTTQLPDVFSGDIDTGHFLRAQVYSSSSLAQVGIGINALALMLDTVGILWGVANAGALILPAAGMLSSLIGGAFYTNAIKSNIKSALSFDDNKIFTKAKKNVSPKTKLTMLFRLPVRETLLLSESDKYTMTHTQGKLVRRAGKYYIEIETVEALKTWDAALESVVPENVRESVEEQAIVRETKRLTAEIREEERLMRDMRMYEEEDYSDYAMIHECSCCAL